MHQQLELFDLEHAFWLYHKVVTFKVTFVTWEVHHTSVSDVCPPEVCDQFDIQTSCHRDNDGFLYNPRQLQAFPILMQDFLGCKNLSTLFSQHLHCTSHLGSDCHKT